MNIVDPTDFATYIREEVSAADPVMTEQARLAAEEDVRNYCQRTFEVAAATATSRVYAPDGSRLLRVDDFIDPTTLIVSNYGALMDPSMFQLLPLNGLSAGSPVAYEVLETFTYWFSLYGRATVTVTARWGWAAVPDPVKEAVKLIGKDYVQQRTTRFGIVTGDFGAAQAGRNWAAMRALAPYRRVEAFGIG